MMSSKPLEPQKPLKPINLKEGKDYIVKKINKKNNYSFTLDDIHNYIRSEETEVPRLIFGTKTVTSYTFYDKIMNSTNDEKNIAFMEEENYNKITLKYDKKSKWYHKDENNKTKYYYIFECPCQTQEESLASVEPAAIKKDKTYLISSCLQRFYVELVDVQEKYYFNDLEIGEDEEMDQEVNTYEIYKLKSYRFKLTSDSKNKDYVKQGEDDLTLFAYKDKQGNYKWKKYNIYKIFVPEALQINKKVIGDISFNSKPNSKTKKNSPKYLPIELSDLAYSFVDEKNGGRKRRRKTRKNNRKI